MKKIMYSLLALAAITLASCQKEEIGATAVEPLSGQWYVQVDGYDLTGDSVVIEDFNGGRILLLTYNNSNNDPDKLYINDLQGFWDFIVLADCSIDSMTFSTSGAVPNESYDCNVTISNGKIVKNGTKTPSGADADYIQFDVTFDDDDLAAYGMPGVSYGDYYGFDVYRVSGWRYTGLVNDD